MLFLINYDHDQKLQTDHGLIRIFHHGFICLLSTRVKFGAKKGIHLETNSLNFTLKVIYCGQ